MDLSGRMGHKVYRDEKIQSQITVTDISILKRDKNDDDDDPNFVNGAKTCSYELYDDCIYNSLTQKMRKNTEDNCTVPYVRDNSKICTKPKDINTTFWMAWNQGTLQQKDCSRPCHSAIVNVGALNYQNKTGKGYGLYFLYYAPRVTQTIEHFLYTTLNLFAEIGGYVGLMLGYSLLHVATLIKGSINAKVEKMEEEWKLGVRRPYKKTSIEMRPKPN